MIIIKAKFDCHCSNTGQLIKKGETCYYDRFQKKVFSLESVLYPHVERPEDIDDSDDRELDIFSNY